MKRDFYNIRNFKEEDEGRISSLHNAIFSKEPMSVRDFRQWYEENKIKPENVLVAESDNKIVGFVFFMILKEERRTLINVLGVDEKYRRRGIASELLRNVFECLIQNDIDSVDAVIDPGNQLSLGLSRKLGFSIRKVDLEIHSSDSSDIDLDKISEIEDILREKGFDVKKFSLFVNKKIDGLSTN